MKLKVFFWLLLQDRLNTKDMLRRRRIITSDVEGCCILCEDNEGETCMHLFIKCRFSVACWARIGIFWPHRDTVIEGVEAIKPRLRMKFSMEIIVTGAWSIWLHRNNCTFRHEIPSINSWLNQFTAALKTQSQRCNPSLRELILEWISNL
ncbi:hypothetical protein GUJ93_ZPchr0004g38702 [Zizania palustris]|uniref:Reverse transcriptase zinc-binding domain-containing protein n=1 Tax=Zizania palustris TaxID=103762 RepID=A0A8J5SSI9_ZIZPA|nr:hypothetical protein GUJ93_ZPchr0004g38702 [Zizania palustris]